MPRNQSPPVKLIIKCDDSDKIERSSQVALSTTLEISNFTMDHKFSLTHDRINKWRNIISTQSNILGSGPMGINVPYGSDLLEFFKSAPAGSYRMDGSTYYNDTLGLPYTEYYYDVIVLSHETLGYKSLIFLGYDGAILTGTIGNGDWSGMVSSGVPIGTPIPYPGTTPPRGYILMNGSSFDKTKFKSLAKLFTDGIIPDMRGQFIRGWDNGKGIDSGRSLLSQQLSNVAAHRHYSYFYSGPNRPAEALLKDIPSGNSFLSMSLDTTVLSPDSLDAKPGSMLPVDDYSTVSEAAKNPNRSAVALPTNTVGSGNETFPRNIAYNYIIRAA